MDGNDSNDGRVRLQGEEATMKIRRLTGLQFSVQVKLDSTVEVLKSIIAQKCEIPAHEQRLIFNGRILNNDRTLKSYGLEADHTVHLVRGFAAATPADSIAIAGSGIEGVSPLGSSGSMITGLSRNRLGTGSGSFGVARPGIEQNQQQLNQNSNTRRNMSYFRDRKTFRNFIRNDPRWAEIEQILAFRNLVVNDPRWPVIQERSPEIARVLDDALFLLQITEIARNRALVHERMHNAGTAVNNTESSPEGFNILEQMHETVLEALLNVSISGGNRSNLGSNQSVAPMGAQGGGARGDPMTSSETTGSERMTALVGSIPNTNPLPNPWHRVSTRTEPERRGSNLLKYTDFGRRLMLGGRGAVREAQEAIPQYKTQLTQLLEMGFFDSEVNIQVLIFLAVAEYILRNQAPR